MKQASGEREDTVHELLAGLAPVAGDGERGSSTCGGYAGEALADVRMRVIGHLGLEIRERRRGWFGSPLVEVLKLTWLWPLNGHGQIGNLILLSDWAVLVLYHTAIYINFVHSRIVFH